MNNEEMRKMWEAAANESYLPTKHTGKELPDHISQLWDERQERGRQRGRRHAKDIFPEPNWKDDEED